MAFRARARPLLLALPVLLAATAAGADVPIGLERALHDAEVEHFLAEGEIVGYEPIGTGVTRPYKVTLKLGDRSMRAAFKNVDSRLRRPVHLADGSVEMEFTDSYKYERAAYLIDRELGLNMVPVAVLRGIRGKQGALIEWVEDAVTEKDRVERKMESPEILRFQKRVMRLFDALIDNTDRNLGNQLITVEDWRLHLIDHSRGFRRNNRLQEKYLRVPSAVSPELLERLSGLNQDRLSELLKGLLHKAQIKSLLKRRDKILSKVEEDRVKFGDDEVFGRDLPSMEGAGTP